ncbi:uncharacterized protein TNCV_1487481 [Trichonephila clavipes]|nr:uncharacterized protein TNCV_1487481 [Trichonephila clavipes]
MAYLGKGRIAELRYIAKQLGEKVYDDQKIIDLKNLIVNSPNYEEFVREMLKQNGLPRPEIGNDTQTRRQRKKEAEKSTLLENENDQFRLRECVLQNGEDFVPSFTGEGTDNGNLVKLSTCEIIEAQLRSEELAHLIRGTENGASDEASDQEGASMQLIPVRHKVITELYVDRIGPLPVIPGHKHILSDLCMSPRYHESVPMISISQSDTAFTPIVEALLQTFRRGFPKEIQMNEKLGTYYSLRMPFTFKNAFNYFSRVMPELPREYKKFDVSYLHNVVVFSEGWTFL